MKNKIKFIFCAACVAVAVCVFISKEGKTAPDSLTLMNIEALASGESGVMCYGTGSVDCPGFNAKVYMVK